MILTARESHPSQRGENHFHTKHVLNMGFPLHKNLFPINHRDKIGLYFEIR